MKHNNRKGVIEIQFNWIFVLVVGAIILIVFFGFAGKQRGISEEITSSSVLNSMDAIITSAYSSLGEVSTISVPKEGISFGCNRIAVNKAARQYENLILFSPENIKSNKLITHTSSLNIPFRVANLLFVTSPSVRYIIIGDFHNTDDKGKFARAVNESLPDEITKDTFYITKPTPQQPDDEEYTDIKNEKHDKVRFVVIDNGNMYPNGPPQGFDKIDDVSILYLSSSNNQIKFGKKDKNNNWDKKDSFYIGNSIIGAIYSDDINQYECSMGNIFIRLKKSNEVYIERSTKLKEDSSLQYCSDVSDSLYNKAIGYLNSIGSAAFDDNGINKIKSAMGSLIDINKGLQLRSCPLIY